MLYVMYLLIHTYLHIELQGHCSHHPGGLRGHLSPAERPGGHGQDRIPHQVQFRSNEQRKKIL